MLLRCFNLLIGENTMVVTRMRNVSLVRTKLVNIKESRVLIKYVSFLSVGSRHTSFSYILRESTESVDRGLNISNKH